MPVPRSRVYGSPVAAADPGQVDAHPPAEFREPTSGAGHAAGPATPDLRPHPDQPDHVPDRGGFPGDPGGFPDEPPGQVPYGGAPPYGGFVGGSPATPSRDRGAAYGAAMPAAPHDPQPGVYGGQAGGPHDPQPGVYGGQAGGPHDRRPAGVYGGQFGGPQGRPPGGPPDGVSAPPAGSNGDWHGDQGRFDNFRPAEDAGPEDEPTPQVRNGRVLLAVLGGAALLLVLPFLIIWALTRSGDDGFAVGSCVKRSGTSAVSADCSDTSAFEIVTRVADTKACPDANQPAAVLPDNEGEDRVLCLKPVAGN